MQSATSPVQQQPAQASTSGVIRPTRGWLDSKFSVYVGNLDLDTSHQDTEELIYELFLQVIRAVHLNINITILPSLCRLAHSQKSTSLILVTQTNTRGMDLLSSNTQKV